MAYTRKTLRLGELLVNKGIISTEDCDAAINMQKEQGIKIGEAFIKLGFVSEKELNDILCEQLNISFVDLDKEDINEEILSVIGETWIRKYHVIPFQLDRLMGNILKVATDNPMDIYAIDDIAMITGNTVEPYLASTAQIDAIIGKFFNTSHIKEMSQKARDMAKAEEAEDKEDEDDIARKKSIEDSPIVKMVEGIISTAAIKRASDIHIEPFEEEILVRYRIDGVLKIEGHYDKEIYNPLIARLKIISGMDIAEKRKPQDGRITQIVNGKEYDIRVSNLPTVFGEKVVMRLASKEAFNMKKERLGFSETDLQKFDNILRNPNGIFLVTGPTGSGKSTTLYTALSELSTEEVNIVTVEDPVEANVHGVNQVHVNPKADLTFASALRSILRQDPDIIMIGEIRDEETAGIAVKAAITGHLVVSTLHTNSTAATVSRLMDMGIEPYLLADSLVGIIAQRLVRRLCPDCKRQRQATEDEKKKLGVDIGKAITIYEKGGVKCPSCDGVGYKGRIGTYEIMPISRNLKSLISKSVSAAELTKAAIEEGMNTLRMAAAKLVVEGTTTFDEMMRITYETEDE